MVCDCPYCFFTHFHTPPVQSATDLAPLLPLPQSPASPVFHIRRLKSVWRESPASEQQGSRALHSSMSASVVSLSLATSVRFSPCQFASTLVDLVQFGFLSSPQKPPSHRRLNNSGHRTLSHLHRNRESDEAGCLSVFFSLILSFVFDWAFRVGRTVQN